LQPDNHAQLVALGWDNWFADRFASLTDLGTVPARVVADHGTGRIVHLGAETLPADLDRPLTAIARRRSDPSAPVVGDWVAIRRHGRRAVIHAVLERRSAFRRKVAGNASQEQVLAANVDIAIVVASLDLEVNLRRLERTLAVAWSSGARPVVLLSKADVASPEAVESLAGEVSRVSSGAPVIALSSMTGEGIERLRELLPAGSTAVLLGPSGAGKSTLVNHLAGSEVMKIGAVRSDGKGRHTTSHRQLLAMPWGGLLIDTPGLRELQLWADADDAGGIDQLFADVEDLAIRCRFSDCRHMAEPGCAVLEAIAAGALTEARMESYRKLHREATAIGRQVTRRRAAAAGLGRRRRIAQLEEADDDAESGPRGPAGSPT
jgi:ribosome biogenesis GTPase / thiamine phosphate phosphatase